VNGLTLLKVYSTKLMQSKLYAVTATIGKQDTVGSIIDLTLQIALEGFSIPN
jgi:hypothetical protein